MPHSLSPFSSSRADLYASTGSQPSAHHEDMLQATVASTIFSVACINPAPASNIVYVDCPPSSPATSPPLGSLSMRICSTVVLRL
nr:hypothetical protein Itr_chr03CG00360 [Ipomoea trifida]